MAVALAADGQVIDAYVPGDLPVATLMADIAGLFGSVGAGRWLRGVSGEWLDPERALGEQGVTAGSVLVLEEPSEHLGEPEPHDAVAARIERAPPAALFGPSAVAVTTGAAIGVGLTHGVPWAATAVPLVVAGVLGLVPYAAAMLSNSWDSRLRWVRIVAACLGGIALGVADAVVREPYGIALVACAFGLIVCGAARGVAKGALTRLALTAAEAAQLIALAPLTVLTGGWVTW